MRSYLSVEKLDYLSGAVVDRHVVLALDSAIGTCINGFWILSPLDPNQAKVTGAQDYSGHKAKH